MDKKDTLEDFLSDYFGNWKEPGMAWCLTYESELWYILKITFMSSKESIEIYPISASSHQKKD